MQIWRKVALTQDIKTLAKCTTQRARIITEETIGDNTLAYRLILTEEPFFNRIKIYENEIISLIIEFLMSNLMRNVTINSMSVLLIAQKNLLALKNLRT